ncbi:MAG: molybdenum cofactor guanylyltransferase [Pseudomonadota bacterium]
MTLALPLLCVLAGGKSSRMDGVDKALVTISGRRMIDIVIERFQPEAGTIVIAGSEDRGTDLTTIPDDPKGPVGPAAALWSVNRWLRLSGEAIDGFFTVPVDAPFLPDDLLSRLSVDNRSTVAADQSGIHPTIGYWQLTALNEAFQQLADRPNPALRAIASACQSDHVFFDPSVLTNVNSMADVKAAESTGRPT